MGYPMKNIKRLWKRQSFARQLTIVFISIFFVQLIISQVLNTYYLGGVLEQKIAESFEQALRQTSQNIDATVMSHKNLIDQLIIDNEFIRAMKRLDDDSELLVRDSKEYLETVMKDFMTYQSDVRCISVKTVGGELFSYDKTQNDLLNQPVSELHKSYYDRDIFDNTKAIKGMWMGTEYLDRRGTKEYYVYSFGKNIYDWYVNRYVGTCIVSIEEDDLSRICQDAAITDDYETNYVFIMDGDGRILSHYDKKMIGRYVVTSSNGKSLVFTDTIGATGWNIVSVLNRDYISKQLKETQKIILILSFFLAVAIAAGVAFVSRRMTKYVKKIIHTMNEIEDGKLSAQVGVNKDEKNEISIIADQFNRMMDKINEQMEMTKQAGIREKEAEIRALEAQINPHFIYNTLDSINWMAIENQQTQISNMLSQFARILRYQIQKSNKIVTIREELEYLEKYLFLQKTRFLHNFEYVIECQESVKECLINKMIFQPFVENAVLHGFADLGYGGLLKIQIRNYDEEHAVFVVSDNGSGMTGEQSDKIFVKRENPGNSIGILNVLARLDLYYGSDYSVKVSSSPGKGTKIETTFPKKYERD